MIGGKPDQIRLEDYLVYPKTFAKLKSLKLMMNTSEMAPLAYSVLFNLIPEELFMQLNLQEQQLIGQKRLSTLLMR